MAPWARGACDPAVPSLRYQFVDSCRVRRPAPILLPTMALEINDGVRQPRLLDRVREANRLRHGSRSTEKSYIGWIRRFILFHGKRHPAEMGAPEVAQFLSSLAVEGQVAASTQNQALSALLFLYRYVLHQELPWLDDVVRARRPKHLPVVLTRDEVRAVISKLDGTARLMATLLYGSGLRLLECARLRVQDVDFAMNQIIVRDGKGAKDRVTVLPAVARQALTRHLLKVKRQHEADLAFGAGWVELPWALARKYPNAGREMAVAVDLPGDAVLLRPRDGPASATSFARIRPAARRVRRSSAGGAQQARHAAYAAALLRHSLARRRTRHSHRPGTAGPQRRQHHDDLYARAQSWACGCDEPRGSCSGSMTTLALGARHELCRSAYLGALLVGDERNPRQTNDDSSLARHVPPRYAARYAARQGYVVLWN
jgi:integron integrase